MPHADLPPSGLLGRRSEREVLDGLVEGVGAGQSRVLVLRGEAGVGKTALLDRLADRAAAACRVVRTAGVESEMELPFAGVHALCGSMLDRVERLPGPQGDALRTAFGLDAGPAPDRFMVSLAVLSLLADAAEEQPLICVVDDAQWLDRVSAQTLSFVARRLLAERVGLVFAVRDQADDHALTGLPDLAVEGLGEHDARRLLDATIPGPLDERVRERILAEAAGNPLALLELPRGMTPATVAGGFGLPTAIPLISRLEQRFVRQLEPLPDPARRLLLLAAAEPIGDVRLLRRGAELLGIGLDDAAPAEAIGLIDIGPRVRFRHPLVRSAAYRAASVADRRDVHRALAEATDPEQDPDRRAWHRAQAATGPDEDVAAELERSAGGARARGGVAAQAAFLARATDLTPDAARRGRRALAAAQATFVSAAPEKALELLAVAELCPLDELQHAQLARLRGEVVFALRRGSDAPPQLLEAARRLEAIDPPAARETHLEALGAAMYSGRLADPGGVRKAAEAARAAPRAPSPARSIDLVLDGMATRFAEGPAAGVPPLRRAVEAFRDESLDGHAATMRWILLCPVVQSMAVFELWDDAAFGAIAARGERLARQAGALTTLPVALVYLSGVHLFEGDYRAASALLHEADAITDTTGNAGLVYGLLLLAAWRGDDAQARQLIDAAMENATTRGEGRVLALGGYATAVLENGLGRYEAALAAARRATEDEDQGYAGAALVELVEAATRAGRPELAEVALASLEVRAQAAGTDWALGIFARARATSAEGDAAEAAHREAIERLERTRMRVELARARLLYGEWLRRESRRVDAREQLQAAHDAFARAGAEAFAERARRELLATGGTVAARTVETRDLLTPQEAQIARLAGEGHSNPEIGAQLFISPRTVEYHLRKVFTKLGISSRKDLGDVLAAPAGPR
ncbi:helix-turn-helix transcriptional regulator [Baekduia sp. Peel2402]|uniref:helix-turn-helix transcriptional regulator n=1 Tax=Baekduia sp. Peel2402 TaxID=3458296 RepID=UPI00403E5D0A